MHCASPVKTCDKEGNKPLGPMSKRSPLKIHQKQKSSHFKLKAPALNYVQNETTFAMLRTDFLPSVCNNETVIKNKRTDKQANKQSNISDRLWSKPQTNANGVNNQVQVEEIIRYTTMLNRTKPTTSMVIQINRLFLCTKHWLN